jgi:putative transposase
VTGWSTRSIRRKVAKKEMFQRDRKKGHGKDSSVREYSTNNLSPAQQVKAEKIVAARNKRRKSSAFDGESNSTQLALFSPPSSSVSSIIIPVKTAQTEQIEKVFKSIEALAEIPDLPDGQRFPRKMPDGKRVRTWTQAEEWQAKQNGTSPKTIHRRWNRFKKNGKNSLVRAVRCDKDKSHFFETYPKAKFLAAYLYLDQKQSATVAFEALVRDAALIEVPTDDLPSYETVRHWLSSMPPALITYAREGKKAYRERMSPYLTRGFTDCYANQIYVGDHAIHDVECFNDCFANVEWGAPIRIRISAMLDYRSRMVVGASWCWEGSSRAIAATMRRAISKFGPPECIYVDNGKDYRKVAKGALPGYLMESPLAPPTWWKAELDGIAATGFLARLGIAVTHCIPHHPQSKHVERFFRTMHERFDKCWNTYTSGNPFTRPEATETAMMRHRRLLKAGRVDESKHPKASLFIMACLAWLDEYANTPHTGEGMDGGTPLEVFNANLNPHQKPSPDPATLALLLAEHERRQVRECAVTLNKRRYQPVDQDGWATMHNLNETEILVAYDSALPEAAAALDENGNFLCALEAEEKVRFAPYDAATQAQIAESMATRRHLEKQTREGLRTLSLIARQNGAETPLESMSKRLRLSPNTDLSNVITQRNPTLSKLNPQNDTSSRPPTPAELARRFCENRLLPGQGADRLAARMSARPLTPAELARKIFGQRKAREAKETADSEFQCKEATG